MLVSLHVGACLVAKVLEICTAEFWVDLDGDGVYSMVSNDVQDPCEGDSVFNLYAEAIYVCFTIMVGMSPAGGTLGGAKGIKEKGAVTITQVRNDKYPLTHHIFTNTTSSAGPQILHGRLLRLGAWLHDVPSYRLSHDGRHL
jgi:hypothetical protein